MLLFNRESLSYDLIKDIHTCDRRWSELIRSISSASAACGTLHPSSRSSQLISSMQSKDISNDPDTMKCLQLKLNALNSMAVLHFTLYLSDELLLCVAMIQLKAALPYTSTHTHTYSLDMLIYLNSVLSKQIWIVSSPVQFMTQPIHSSSISCNYYYRLDVLVLKDDHVVQKCSDIVFVHNQSANQGLSDMMLLFFSP